MLAQKYLITSIARALPWLLFTLLCGIESKPLHAELNLEITRPPIVLNTHDLNKISPADREAQTQAIVNTWVQEYARSLPLVYPGAPGGGTQALEAHRVEPTLNDKADEAVSKLVVQIVHFADDVSSRSSSFAEDFHAQFMHVISSQAPGFAWVVMAERSGFALDWMDGFRVGGAAGIQIPILGSEALWLKDKQGQVVLRVLPVGGNYEAIQIATDTPNSINSPDTGIVLRPTAELEADYKMGNFQPGMRLLVQPRLLQPNEARMIAEVYMNIDFSVTGSEIKQVSIVPRCVIDFSNDTQNYSGPNALAFAEGHQLLNKDANCSISAEFAFSQ